MLSVQKGKKMKMVYIQIFLAGLFLTSPTAQEVKIDNEGESVTAKNSFGKIERCWKEFAHEFDWRITGPGRVKVYQEDGTPAWKQLIYPEDPKATIYSVQKLDSWKNLIEVIKLSPEKSLRYFRTLETSIPKEYRIHRDELNYSWYALAAALEPKLFQLNLGKDSDKAIRSFKKGFNVPHDE